YPPLFRSRTALAFQRLARDRVQRALCELELYAIHLEQLLKLLRQAVLRRRQDVDQRVFGELVQRRQHRQTPDELWDQPKLQQVFGLHLRQEFAELHFFAPFDVGAEAQARLTQPALDDLIQADERPAADEQDVARVDLQEVLLRVLTATLRRHVGDGALDDLQERLLHAFARYVARDRGVVALAADLVDFVDVDDAPLRALHVVVGVLKQLHDDVFDVFAHVPGFGQGRGVGDREGHLQDLGERLCQQRL